VEPIEAIDAVAAFNLNGRRVDELIERRIARVSETPPHDVETVRKRWRLDPAKCVDHVVIPERGAGIGEIVVKDGQTKLAPYVVKVGVHGRLEIVDRVRRIVTVAENAVGPIARLGPTGRESNRLIAEVGGGDEAFHVDARGRDAAANRNDPV